MAAFELTKKMLLDDDNKNATKGDIKKLSVIVRGQRYFKIDNIPKNNHGRTPFFDIQTNNLIFLYE